MDMVEINHTWESLKILPKLNENQIQVWKVKTPNYFYQLSEFERFLGKDEKTRASCYKFQDQRQNFIVSRGILRFLIARFLDEDPETLYFKSSLDGKLFLDDKYHQHQVKFNISHSGEICLMAISRNIDVGIDVEVIRPLPNLEELAKKFLSQKELKYFHSIPSKKRLGAFYNFWSAKEALLKVLGCGLLVEPRLIEIQKIFDKKHVSIQKDSTIYDLSQNELISMVGINGYVAWLASEKKAEVIRKIDFSKRLLSS